MKQFKMKVQLKSKRNVIVIKYLCTRKQTVVLVSPEILLLCLESTVDCNKPGEYTVEIFYYKQVNLHGI